MALRRNVNEKQLRSPRETGKRAKNALAGACYIVLRELVNKRLVKETHLLLLAAAEGELHANNSTRIVREARTCRRDEGRRAGCGTNACKTRLRRDIGSVQWSLRTRLRHLSPPRETRGSALAAWSTAGAAAAAV